MSASSYEESISGPLKPGCHFYKWLLRGGPLHINIPDTLIVEKNIVRYIYNDANGLIVKSKPISDSAADRKSFILNVLQRFLLHQSSHPPSTAMSRQVVGIIKRPHWKSGVSNDTEVLLPLPLAAQLLDAVEGRPGPYVIQKYMWFRGKRPCIYRAFWKAGSPTSARSVVVWNIASKESIQEFHGDHITDTLKYEYIWR